MRRKGEGSGFSALRAGCRSRSFAPRFAPSLAGPMESFGDEMHHPQRVRAPRLPGLLGKRAARPSDFHRSKPKVLVYRTREVRQSGGRPVPSCGNFPGSLVETGFMNSLLEELVVSDFASFDVSTLYNRLRTAPASTEPSSTSRRWSSIGTQHGPGESGHQQLGTAAGVPRVEALQH